MTSIRLALARLASKVLPPLISNRLTLRMVYPYERARRDGFDFRSRAVTGSYFHGNLHDVHSYMMAIHGYFDWRLIGVVGAVLGPGDIAVEVGANVGTETIALADLVGPEGRVYAIEPLPSNVEQLRKLNDLSGLKQVEVLPVAVSDTVGTVQFAPPPDLAHSGLGHIHGRDEEDEARLITTACTTLDTLFSEHGPIRLISMDAEGAELNILRGARACLTRDGPVLIVEAAAPLLRRFGHDVSDLHGELMSLGYRVYQLARFGLCEPDLSGHGGSNWLGLPDSMKDDASQIHRRLLLCGLAPCLNGLNPLTRSTSKRMSDSS